METQSSSNRAQIYLLPMEVFLVGIHMMLYSAMKTILFLLIGVLQWTEASPSGANGPSALEAAALELSPVGDLAPILLPPTEVLHVKRPLLISRAVNMSKDALVMENPSHFFPCNIKFKYSS